MLNDDTKGPTPHLCIAFAATSRLLVVVSRVASAFQDDGLAHEALGICGLLIDSEEEAFLQDPSFAEALPKFVESLRETASGTTDLDTESAMLEVLFGIASRIRFDPEILPTWFKPGFHPDDMPGHSETSNNLEERVRSQDFPLFYLLLQFVPAEGRAGEFARMGLLYIIESSEHSEELEKWIVDGDMAALMASGLGALYGQLSRKLTLCYAEDETPSVLTFSNHSHLISTRDAESTTSSEYQAHLATFLASLVFWQDLLEHCPSKDVRETLLDHFQALFLQQLLYPSLLESSDVDGGSAVAVLTYLRHILESIDHPELVHLTLQYLFGIRKTCSSKNDASQRPTTLARRRKSENLLSRLGEDEASPDLFNLADLIMAGLRSESQQTITAALELTSVLLRRQHIQLIPALLKTRAANDTNQRRTIGAQHREIKVLVSISEGLAVSQNLEISYGKYLEDNRNLIESHSCSVQLRNHVIPSDRAVRSELGTLRRNMHYLITDDPMLTCSLELMERFFWNDIETNLSLTQTMTDLATCGYTRLECWLLEDPASYRFDIEDSVEHQKDEEQDQSLMRPTNDLEANEARPIRDVFSARREPVGNVREISPVFSTLDLLTQQVETVRRHINDFDALSLECRMIVTADEDSDAIAAEETPELARDIGDSQLLSPSPSKAPSQMGSLPTRLRHGRTSASSSPSVSRTGSPRGRRLDLSSTPTLVGRLPHLQISPTRISSHATSRTHSLSPFPKGSLPSTPPKAKRRVLPTPAALHRKIRITKKAGPTGKSLILEPGSESSSVKSESLGQHQEGYDEVKEVSLGHLLTNLIILQEFILELAALIEVRATLFDEVRYV